MKNKPFWDDLNIEIIHCKKCERLVEWRERIAIEKRRMFQAEEYWGKPIPGFGDPEACILVVGLAPGAHGANRTGRMFTGDSSGRFLYRALYKAGFANQPDSLSVQDGLQLNKIYISAVCRCAPPGNKPTTQEIKNCSSYLYREIHALDNLKAIVALGRIAFDQVRSYFQMTNEVKFNHAAEYTIPNNSSRLIASYHPSRQNTQTGRLTEEMFDKIWKRANEIC